MGIFTPMKNFLLDLEAHNLQNRTVSIIENGSWSPAAGDQMMEIIDRMGNMRYAGEKVTFMSSPDHDTYQALTALVDAVVASLEDDSDAAPEAVTEGSVRDMHFSTACSTWVIHICTYIMCWSVCF